MREWNGACALALALLACDSGGGGNSGRDMAPRDAAPAADGRLSDAGSALDAARDTHAADGHAPQDPDARPPRPRDARAADARLDAMPADARAADARLDVVPPDADLQDARVDPTADGAFDAGPARDAAADARPPDPSDAGPARLRGQCAVAADCPSGDCSRSAPGGFCLGAPCPPGHELNEGGGCSRPCGDAADCPLGLRCTRGLCALVRCDVDAACQPPYDCIDGFCRRPSCDPGACPASLHCVRSICVED